MRSRALREGSVGLLILGALGLLTGIILWLRGFNPTNQSYGATIEFSDLRGLSDVSGVHVGAAVRYRGITVGRVIETRISTNGVEVDIEIAPASLVIPKDVTVEFNQGGLVGETSIDLVPKTVIPSDLMAANPLASDCNPQVILCNGAKLEGQIGASFQRLVNSTVRFADLFGNQKFYEEVVALTRNSSAAAAGVTSLSKEVTSLTRSVKQNLGELTDAAAFSAVSVGQAANQFSLTAGQVNQLVAENRSSLVSTLDNINRTSAGLENLVQGLSPSLREGQEVVENFRVLSENAVVASRHLRNLTGAVGTQENILLLQQTLDSARSTFQNVDKITSDLDELTGDPTLREKIRNLIQGLSGLVSSTQQLQQQAQYATVLRNTQVAVQTQGNLQDRDRDTVRNENQNQNQNEIPNLITNSVVNSTMNSAVNQPQNLLGTTANPHPNGTLNPILNSIPTPTTHTSNPLTLDSIAPINEPAVDRSQHLLIPPPAEARSNQPQDRQVEEEAFFIHDK